MYSENSKTDDQQQYKPKKDVYTRVGSTKRKTSLTKQNSLVLASQNSALTNYVESVKKKQEENEDYAKWDLTKPLPKLPLPELESTMEKYLRCVKPIRSPEAYQKTVEIVQRFKSDEGEGKRLQEIIKKASEEKDNWAYDWWLDDMYLTNKLPLPMNSNPGMVYPQEHFTNEADHLKFAARLISGIMDYKLVIDSETLPVDRLTCRERGQPLCMDQYYRLFTLYRVPGLDKDKLIDTTTNSVFEPEHVIVMCQNQIFVLDVVVNFERLSETQLYEQLRRIKQQSEEDNEANSGCRDVGFLTSMARDEWAKARAELVQDSTNRDLIDIIERSIFVLCLDKQVPIRNSNTPTENDIEMFDLDTSSGVSISSSNSNLSSELMNWQALQMLHGMGSEHNSGNRWFDKTMQFIVAEDGVCGVNYEHSAAEGIVVVELSEHLFRYIERKKNEKNERRSSLAICDLACPKKLKWNLNETIFNWIGYAKKRFDNDIEQLDINIWKFDKFGRDFPKKIKMSPDSFIQLSLQYAYYKLYNRLCSTYESASTRRFRSGRVDNIRANSCEALEWVQAMSSTSFSTEEKIRLFRKAVQYQTDLMIETILGNGMDCHINTLKCVANENGMSDAEFLQDESFRISNYFQLSTSQIPTSFEGVFMCYGAVVPDGYGCSYNPKPDYILFCLSSSLACPETSTERFTKALDEALTEIYELFD